MSPPDRPQGVTLPTLQILAAFPVRSLELEAIGGAILAMDGREWRAVAEAAR